MSATRTTRTTEKACRKESSVSRVLDLKNFATKTHNSQQCGDEEIKSRSLLCRLPVSRCPHGGRFLLGKGKLTNLKLNGIFYCTLKPGDFF